MTYPHYIVSQTSTLAVPYHMVSHHRFRSLRHHASLLHSSFWRAPREGTTGLRNPASRNPVRERGGQVFRERTRATAGNDDFFPDLGNLILNDMGDNINVGPTAPYVILSFLFEIVVEFIISSMCPRCDLFICYASSHD